jgi:hypothetical protein
MEACLCMDAMENGLGCQAQATDMGVWCGASDDGWEGYDCILCCVRKQNKQD